MKYSYLWLKELSGTKKLPDQLAELLTMHSFESEEICQMGLGLESVVVGEIKNIKKHPNADRLQLAKVSIGGKKLHIVCGAPNIAVGQKIPVALDGAVLLSGHAIHETKIRGQKSQGMLCSELDLGIGEDHSGIMILPKNAKVGENFAKLLGLDDFLIQLDVLANRGHDALSHVGMSREICALENKKLAYKVPKLESNKSSLLKIKIEDPSLCRRYIGALLDGIEIAPSPVWMQARLKTCGVRPINNIVDITNYVMLELGQPLHAFDSEKISTRGAGAKIVVRRAKKGERLKLLDENELKLSESNLLITNGKDPLALAGVMGGEKSGVSGNTISIVLESANFEPVNIRKTRTAHGISTESSYRFERDIDPNLAGMAAMRAIELLKEYGGKNAKLLALADIYPNRIKPWTIKLDLDYANRLLGENVAAKQIKSILENLDLKVKASAKYYLVEIPTFRIDLKTQEDLIEEIGRIYGYENIPAKAPIIELASPPANKQKVFEDHLRDIASALGFSEILNYSFYSKDDIEKCNLDLKEHFEVANPMNPDQQYLRTALAPGIFKNIELNLKNFSAVQIFEIGHLFSNDGGKVEEYNRFAGALTDSSLKDDLFFVLKGKLEAFLENIGIRNSKFEIQNSVYRYWHPGRTASIVVKGEKIGCVGEISPHVLKLYGIDQRVAMFGLKIDKVIDLANSEKIFKPISKYPSLKRDISMFVPESVGYAAIEKEISNAGDKLVNNIELFDIFEKEGKKSLALRLEIRSSEKTLTSEEIDGVMKKIVDKLENDLKVRVRK